MMEILGFKICVGVERTKNVAFEGKEIKQTK